MGGVAILLVLVAVAVVGFVAYPLLAAASRDRRVTQGPSELDALLRRKALLYSNMKDLEFEFQMGKLSEADHERLRAEDRAEAARILREIDALEDRGDVDAIIEREIAARRAGAPVVRRSPAMPEPPPGPALFCTGCGARAREGDRFCGRCGRSLEASAPE
jgi:hypothetical protein